jgi:hypothetical protein
MDRADIDQADRWLSQARFDNVARTTHVDFVDPGPWIQGGIDNAGQMENQTGTLNGCPDVVLFPDVTK